MTLWGNIDRANNAPIHQVAANTTSAVTGQDIHANVTPNTIYIDTAAGHPNAIFGVYGVSSDEVAHSSYSGTHGGWVKRVQYTDVHGNTRVKEEVLVATGSIQLDAANTGEIANTTGTVDDSFYPE